MTRTHLVGVSGNMQRPSRTLGLTTAIVEEIALRTSVESTVFDLVDLGPELGATLDARRAPPRLAGLIDAIAGADALVVASPVYKGAYAGLFKHLFDVIDPGALAGKPLVIAATGGGERHALVVEHALRPLFAFFGAAVAPTAVYAAEKEFLDYRPSQPPLLARIGQAADEVAALVVARRQPLARTA
jgi:FMN reductase